MELAVLAKIHKLGLPRIVRLILAFIMVIAGVVFSFVPVIPGTIFLIVGVALFIPIKKVSTLIKMRKGFVHLIRNFSIKKLQYKIKDFKKHLYDIFLRRRK